MNILVVDLSVSAWLVSSIRDATVGMHRHCGSRINQAKSSDLRHPFERDETKIIWNIIHIITIIFVSESQSLMGKIHSEIQFNLYGSLCVVPYK